MVLIIYTSYRGREFRTSFTRIGGLRALADVPFMALSASAPPSVAKVIEDSLQLKSPLNVTHNLDRPNIFLSCAKSKGLTVSKLSIIMGFIIFFLFTKRDLAGVADMLSRNEVPKTLIFCCTRDDCAKVYGFLSKSARRQVSMYHSSLTQTTKTEVQSSFGCGGQLRCLSATVAFGMVIAGLMCIYSSDMAYYVGHRHTGY